MVTPFRKNRFDKGFFAGGGVHGHRPHQDLNITLRDSIYFDRSVFKRHWPEFNRDPLKRAGALVRIIAIRSIRKAKRLQSGRLSTKASAVAKPPKSRAPGHPIRKIFFDTTGPFKTQVIIGAVRLIDKASLETGVPVPSIHEHGREVTVNVPQEPKWRTNLHTKERTMTRRYKRMHIKYPPRPFMVPALHKARESNALSQMWKDSVK